MPIDRRRLAALDMGTNTFKMSVFEATNDDLIQIHDENRVVRVARLIDNDGMLPATAIEHLVSAVIELTKSAKVHGAHQFNGVATQGFRTARNGADVLQQVAEATPWTVELISGDEEAELTFSGLVDQLPATGTAVIVDIGGGSTEVVVTQDREKVLSTSLRVGSGVLTDQFVRHDPPLAEELDAAEAAASSIVAMKLEANRQKGRVGTLLLAGGAGQFLERTSLDRLARGLSLDTLMELRRILLSTSSSELGALLGIPIERAQVIPAGHRVALAMMNHYAPNQVRAVESGIRRGLMRRVINAQQ